MAKDITNIVEAPSDFQAHTRVRITGVYASVTKSDDEYDVTINGEVTPIKGDALDANLSISAIIYDSKGRVLRKSDEHIDADGFFKFEAFSINLYVPSAPAKICLVPRTQSSSSSDITIQLD